VPPVAAGGAPLGNTGAPFASLLNESNGSTVSGGFAVLQVNGNALTGAGAAHASVGDSVAVPHTPSSPQVSTVVVEVQRVAFGVHSPLQAVPTQTFKHETGATL
jgi:hypothetical protein